MILHLDTETEWRGGQQQAIYLIEGLLQRDIPCLLICRQDSKLRVYAEKHNLPFQTLPLRAEYDFISICKLKRIIKTRGVKLVHCHNSHALGLLIFTKFLIDVPVVASRRVDFPLSSNIFSKYKYNSSKLDRLICISDNIRAIVDKSIKDKSKLVTIRSAVDVTKAEWEGDAKNVLQEFPKSEFIIGTVAALTGHKDYPTLVEAARIVLETHPEVKFVAVGEGKLRAEIELLLQEKSLTKNFLLLGYKSNVYDYLKRFNIFVLASKLEGLGTSVLDALSCGKTIVATDAGGIPEMIKDRENGLLVPRQNPEELAKAILELIAKPSLREKLAVGAQESVHKFDLKPLIDNHIQLYSELAKDD